MWKPGTPPKNTESNNLGSWTLTQNKLIANQPGTNLGPLHMCCICAAWPFFFFNISLLNLSFLILHSYHPPLSCSPYFPPTSTLIHSSERVKSRMGSQSLTHHFESGKRPLFWLSKVCLQKEWAQKKKH